MAAFFNFDEILKNFGFNNEFMERLEGEFNEIEKKIKSGKIKGEWDIKQIDEPGRKGYIIQGRFWSDKPIETFDPFEPFKPWRRPPMPKRPFEVPETTLKETREPLTDVFEEDKAVKIYIELPGEDKDDIELNVMKGKVEVKGKKFHKIIEVPTKKIDIENASSKYKNGVLEVVIPKKEKSPARITDHSE